MNSTELKMTDDVHAEAIDSDVSAEETAIRKIGWRDRLGICLSTLCLVHCILTPFVLGFLPVGAAMGIWQHGFHQVFLLVVPFVAMIAFVPGWKQHRDSRVWYWGAAGILLLFAGVGVAEMFGHHAAGMSNSLLAELVLTASGGGCLIRAHLLNRALCACCQHDHSHGHGHPHAH